MISSSIDITEHKQIERELVERAHIDELTGLPDRILIQEHVEAAIARDDRSSRRFALAFIDLDNFKHINDYYSHAIGDALLVKIGQRIASGFARATCSRASAATSSCCCSTRSRARNRSGRSSTES